MKNLRIGAASMGYERGGIQASWSRWSQFAKPGRYIANISALEYSVCQNVDCVVDDFGDLVGVPA